MINPDKQIVLDADVIIHFIKGDRLFYLPDFLSNKIIILDKVYEEIVFRRQQTIIDKFLKFPTVEFIHFPDDELFISEYAHLTSIRGLGLGAGESACLVYARFNKNVLASSNLKDIKRYCSFHNIEHVTTIDLLVIGYEKGIFTEQDCDEFIETVRRAGSKLPEKRFSEILEERKP